MKTLNLIQGSQEWHNTRAKSRNASEAPAMMGDSKYQKRDELLKIKATGITPEVTPAQQRIFDKGHKAEEAARPHIENQIHEELYPVAAVHDEHEWLLASFDGCSMMEDVLFEHKLWNEKLAERVRNQDLEPHYYWQLEQQLLVSGAEKVIFVVSDGTPDKMVQMEYKPVPGRADALLAGWAQFEEDLANYSAEEPATGVIEVKRIDNLPTLFVEVSGQVNSSNLPEYREHALALFDGINTDLQSDQDFAEAENMVKFCKDAEKKIEAVKLAVMTQAADINAVMEALEEVKEAARQKRLLLDKEVKAKKEQIKQEIIATANQKLNEYLIGKAAAINAPIQINAGNFATAIKGKRTISSIQSAVNDELAKAKIEATEQADLAAANLKLLDTHANSHKFLFNDWADIAFKSSDDFSAVMTLRIQNYETGLQAQREAEEQARAEVKAQQADELPHPYDSMEAISNAEPITPKVELSASSTTEAAILDYLVSNHELEPEEAQEIAHGLAQFVTLNESALAA